MGGAPFGPCKHQVLAIASATPPSFPKSPLSPDHLRSSSTVCRMSAERSLWRGRRRVSSRSPVGRRRMVRGGPGRYQPRLPGVTRTQDLPGFRCPSCTAQASRVRSRQLSASPATSTTRSRRVRFETSTIARAGCVRDRRSNPRWQRQQSYRASSQTAAAGDLQLVYGMRQEVAK